MGEIGGKEEKMSRRVELILELLYQADKDRDYKTWDDIRQMWADFDKIAELAADEQDRAAIRMEGERRKMTELAFKARMEAMGKNV